jgi:cytochrome bd ubiquinol oxidase subunit II
MDAWLPHVFAAVMGLALLLYVILDGYDLGVGLLLPFATDAEKNQMISSIGPFWDANETWIVLGVGVLLIAFPAAHGIILTSLYLPATLMLMGLVLRGIAFDFRVKAGSDQKPMWNAVFSIGSLVTAACQGWMLGSYITGLDPSPLNLLFSLLAALALPTLYVMLGAIWLMCRTTAPLSNRARHWARRGFLPLGVAMLVVSVATPIISDTIAARWFSLPEIIGLAPVPVVSAMCYGFIGLVLFGQARCAPQLLFIAMIMICLLSALGLAYSLYPDIIIGRMSITQAAASTATLRFTLWGVLLTLPLILGYTIFVYRIFSGKVPANSSYD